MASFRIGADPEVFCFKEDVGFKSVIGTIGGTKSFPRPLPIGEGFAVQEDNVALEFNIPASGSKSEFVRNIEQARTFLQTLMFDQYGWLLSKDSATLFPEEELNTPEAKIFGCDPDFNAWTQKVNPRPKAADARLRSAGGHVHIGCDLRGDDLYKLGQACDFYMGVPSVLIDNGELRKQLYGKAGCIRIKPYGLEYRTLSNFWIFDAKHIEWVYDQAEKALDAVRAGTDFSKLKKQIVSCINKNDKDLARQLVEEYELTLV